MDSDLLEKIQTRMVREKELVRVLEILKSNALRSVPEWTNCINISLVSDEDLANNWEVVLNTFAGKLVHSNKWPLEMAIANSENRSCVWVRTGELSNG